MPPRLQKLLLMPLRHDDDQIDMATLVKDALAVSVMPHNTLEVFRGTTPITEPPPSGFDNLCHSYPLCDLYRRWSTLVGTA